MMLCMEYRRNFLMLFARRLGSIFALCFLLIKGEETAIDQRRAKTCQTILLVGDSLAVGLAPRLQTLTTNTASNLIAEGIVGTNTCQWKEKIFFLIERYKPGTVFISLGTNDAVLESLGPGWAQKNADCYEKTYADAASKGAKVIWILPPKLPQKLEDGRKKVVEQILKISDANYDSYVLQIPRAPDGIHMSPQGYAEWANKMWEWWNLLF